MANVSTSGLFLCSSKVPQLTQLLISFDYPSGLLFCCSQFRALWLYFLSQPCQYRFHGHIIYLTLRNSVESSTATAKVAQVLCCTLSSSCLSLLSGSMPGLFQAVYYGYVIPHSVQFESLHNLLSECPCWGSIFSFLCD